MESLDSMGAAGRGDDDGDVGLEDIIQGYFIYPRLKKIYTHTHTHSYSHAKVFTNAEGHQLPGQCFY